MYVFIIRMQVYVCMSVHASMNVCIHNTYECMDLLMYVCMHACMYECMYLRDACMKHVCMCVCMRVCMYVTCMHVCIYMYVCVHVGMCALIFRSMDGFGV